MELNVQSIIGYLIAYLLESVALYKIFEKAGKTPWHGFVPFLNVYDLFDICWEKEKGLVYIAITVAMSALSVFMKPLSNALGGAALLIVLLMIVLLIALLVMHFKMSFRLAKSFGKGTGFGIGLALLSTIFLLILGFGSDTYLGNDK